mmetsp:Transcript_64926/g.127677  ORF Transcript_64926/g.127677 Transcript_64926/m.127677 type:complete len:305 (-) Transcript_64926:2-916(-)
MDQGRVSEPVVPVRGHLRGLARQVVEDVQGQLQLLVDAVVKLDGGRVVRAEPDDELHWQGGAQAPQHFDHARLVRHGGLARDGRCGQTVCDDDEEHHLTPRRQRLEVPLDARADVLEALGDGRHAPRPVVLQQRPERLHLVRFAAARAVDMEAISAILHGRALRPPHGVQEHELARRADAQVPTRVVLRERADLLPPRAGSPAPPAGAGGRLRDHGAVGGARRARVVQEVDPQADALIVLGHDAGEPRRHPEFGEPALHQCDVVDVVSRDFLRRGHRPRRRRGLSESRGSRQRLPVKQRMVHGD